MTLSMQFVDERLLPSSACSSSELKGQVFIFYKSYQSRYYQSKRDNIMARPLRIEFEDAFYHIIQRGIERKNIFISETDKNRFLSYLDQAYRGYGAIIHTYTLMNNHYHLILQTPRANLSKIMHYLDASYAA